MLRDFLPGKRKGGPKSRPLFLSFRRKRIPLPFGKVVVYTVETVHAEYIELVENGLRILLLLDLFVHEPQIGRAHV